MWCLQVFNTFDSDHCIPFCFSQKKDIPCVGISQGQHLLLRLRCWLRNVTFISLLMSKQFFVVFTNVQYTPGTCCSLSPCNLGNWQMLSSAWSRLMTSWQPRHSHWNGTQHFWKIILLVYIVIYQEIIYVDMKSYWYPQWIKWQNITYNVIYTHVIYFLKCY